MKFSIIIPMYNAEKYISETLESLVHQTKKNFEVVIINDGSTDKSEIIVEEYLKKLPITYIKKVNSGQLLSRREGVKVANGEYLLFLDADDLLRSDTIELLDEVVDKYKEVSVVMFGAVKFNDKEQIDYLPSLIDVEGDMEIPNLTFLIDKVIDTKELNNLCFKCIKKTIFNKIMDTKPVDANIEEDLIEFIHILRYIEKAVYLNEKIYLYRQNMESISHEFNEKYFESVRNISMEIENELQDFNIYQFKKRVAYRFVKSLYGSIIQLESKKCKKTRTEKINYLKEISNDTYYRKIMKLYGKDIQEKHIRYVLAVLYHHCYNVCLTMAKIKCLINKVFRKC